MDNMRKIAIMGKVFSDIPVVIDVAINGIKFESLDIVQLKNNFYTKEEKQAFECYPIATFDIPYTIICDNIPLFIKIMPSSDDVEFYFLKIKGTRMLRYGVMGETLEDLFTNTAYSDGKTNVIVDGVGVEISDEEWEPYIHKTHIQNDDCLQCIKVNRGDWVYKFSNTFACDVTISGDYGIIPVNPTPTKQGITVNGETIALFDNKKNF